MMVKQSLNIILDSDCVGKEIDYELFLDCVHCGLCTSACPTYVELGTEMDSPRGRIYLMRGVVDKRIPLDDQVKKHLDLCLNCRSCETACPSGVQYGKILEPFRSDLVKNNLHNRSMTRWQEFMIFQVFPYRWRAKAALGPAKWLQWLKMDRYVRKILPSRIRGMLDFLPELKTLPPIPEFLPAIGNRRATVVLFTGCINDVVLRQVNWATAKVLQINGCDVWTSSSQGCCGALHLHNGRENQAVDFATQLVTDMQKYKNIDAIINNIAGCGSTLKEYEHLLESTPISKQGTWFQSKVKDIHEFLSELKPVKPTRPLRMKAVYHDACHLCHAQKIRQQPRELLGIIPELELVPLNETEICCGAAGSYNLSQPEMAERLGNRKWQNILKTDVKAVFTGNAGCLLQIAKHKRFSNSDICVVHPVQALWASYSGEPLESI